jgi:hypothetical protein
MKRIHIYLIITALLLCILALTFAIVSRTRALEAANTLAVDISRLALSNWNAELVISNADRSLLDQGGDDFFYTYFSALGRLGTLQEISDISYTVDLPAILLSRDGGNVSYTMNAIFSQGQAEVRITVMRHDGRWWFSEYLVLTPALAS